LLDLGLMHTAAYSVGAIALCWQLHRRTGALAAGWARVGRAVVAGGVMTVGVAGLARWWPTTTRRGSLVEVVVVGLVGAAIYLGTHRLLNRGPLVELGVSSG
jgi:peptidoglycan biosynthesis protein MviN/MurJ (putative lipid II flippase)